MICDYGALSKMNCELTVLSVYLVCPVCLMVVAIKNNVLSSL